MKSSAYHGDAARAAGRMLALLDGPGCRELGAEWRRMAGGAPRPAAEGGEAERWELLAAIAEDARCGPSPTAVLLLRHLAAGPTLAASPSAVLQ
jgi:hypothetical protein